MMRALVERTDRFDRAALVPPQQDNAPDHQQDTDEGADEAAANALQPAGRARLGNAVVTAAKIPGAAKARRIIAHRKVLRAHPMRCGGEQPIMEIIRGLYMHLLKAFLG